MKHSLPDPLTEPLTVFPSAAVSPCRGRLFAGAATLACLGVASLSIDLPVAQWCKTAGIPKELMRLLNFSEVFAHSMGVAVILLTVLVLDPTLRFPSFRWPALRWPSFQPTVSQEQFARMICAAAAGGLIVDVIKLLVDRVRPRAADLVAEASVFSTFGDSLLLAAHASHSDVNSFPSGHSAVAAGLAAALAWKYPRGWLLFLVFAVLAALQRVATSAHYPSDICLGAAVGLLGAAIFLASQDGEKRTGTGSPVSGS